MRTGHVINYRLTAAEIASFGTAISGGMIEEIDANGLPTGVIYQVGAAGVPPEVIGAGGGTVLTTLQTDALNSLAIIQARIIPNFTASNTAVGVLGTYTVSANSEYAAVWAAWKACQANKGTGGSDEWATASITTNFWIRIQLPVAKVVKRIDVAGRTSAGEYPNTGWKFQGSQDGITFVDLYTATAPMGSALVSIPITNTVAYTYYRMFSATTPSGSNPGMAAFFLFGDAYAFQVSI